MAADQRPVVKGKSFKDGEPLDIVSLYPSWEVGVAYPTNAIVQFEGKLYQVMQDHNSQADWTPATVPALFKGIGFVTEGPAVGTPIWVQPQGGHDAYPLGAIVSHEGVIWESTAPDNVWAPGVYGWVAKV